MEARISLLRTEIESRGGVWGEYEAGEPKPESEVSAAAPAPLSNGIASTSEESTGRSNPWADGTFTTGRIVGGEVVLNSAPGAPTTNVESRVNGVPSAGSRINGTANTNTGGTLDDETLRRAMELRMQEDDGEDEEDGMHL